jgi:plasmid stabilization system protein ParE
MKKYKVYISKEAREDLKEIADYIADELKAPGTSKKYAVGLIQEIKQLSKHAASIAVSTHKSILKYGDNARRVHFKNHTIIYTVQGKTVIIRRIMASALIKE